MSGPNVLTVVREDGVATITLNRPELHNAFNEALIAELSDAFETLSDADTVRAVVLRANGKSFCAGADLDWMQRMADYSMAENIEDAMTLARLMSLINRCPKPVVALVQGPAVGGGVGLAATADIAIASDTASFRLSEAALGITPATISPYVLRAIGERAARRYFLTAESFSALEAHRLGLVHEVVPEHMLDAAAASVLDKLLGNSTMAQAASKDLIFAVVDKPIDAAMITDTAQRIAAARASTDGREGVAAFLEKRKPAWRADRD